MSTSDTRVWSSFRAYGYVLIRLSITSEKLLSKRCDDEASLDFVPKHLNSVSKFKKFPHNINCMTFSRYFLPRYFLYTFVFVVYIRENLLYVHLEVAELGIQDKK